jgi:hypothetical protein
MYKFLFLFFLSFCQASVNAQVAEVHTPETVDSLLKYVIDKNEADKTIDGVRIQVFSGNERAKANEAKAKVLTEFPNATIKLIYQSPNYKVRVGNFRDRIEAQQMFHELLEIFPQSFIVPDKIDLPPIK